MPSGGTRPQFLGSLVEFLPLFCGASRSRAGAGDPEPLHGARSVPGGAQVHPLRRARYGRRRGARASSRSRIGSMTACRWRARSRSNARAHGTATMTGARRLAGRGRPVRPEEVTRAHPRRAAEPRPHRAAALGRAARHRDSRRNGAAPAVRPYRDDGLGRGAGCGLAARSASGCAGNSPEPCPGNLDLRRSRLLDLPALPT